MRKASRLFVVIPCGGTGSRAGAGLPKQYRVIAGRMVLAHTLTALAAVPGLSGVCVAVEPGGEAGDQPAAKVVAEVNASLNSATYESTNAITQVSSGTSKLEIFAVGCAGPTRAITVFNGLEALAAQGAEPSDWVLVHDAARCLITTAQVTALIEVCATDPVGGLLAHKLPDTLKQEGTGAAAGRVSATLDRSDKWLAQTPQMFRLGALRDALRQAGEAVTDEASAMEFIGLRPRLVPGSAQNFKVTYPEDFALAEAILLSRAV